MKTKRKINYFLLVIVVSASCYISLGAKDGTYGKSQLSGWGLYGQQQEEETWCIFAAMSTIGRYTGPHFTQCNLATYYAEYFFNISPPQLPDDCCNKPFDTSSNSYYIWGTFCLIRNPAKSIPYFVNKYLKMKSLQNSLYDQAVYGHDNQMNIFPCIGIDLVQGHAIVISGVTKRTFSGYPTIIINYFDPLVGLEALRTLTVSERARIVCLTF